MKKKVKEENDTITIETGDTTVTIETDGDGEGSQTVNPTPRDGETAQTFMTRCMLDSTMLVQFPDQKQRNRACERALNGGVGSMNMNMVNNIVKNFALRREQRDGRNFVVVPIIALVEGVHSGSGGPTYYPANEIAETAGAWRGVPLTIDHPNENGNPISALNPDVLKNWSVGTFENVRFEDGKLKGEGWIDLDRVAELSPETLQMIQEGRPLEVSTGLFTTSDGQSGTFRGEEFDSTVSDFVPDHLALLPNAVGACSFRDGCGVRNNKQGCTNCKLGKTEGGEKAIDEKVMDAKEVLSKGEDLLQAMKQSFVFNEEFTLNEISHSEIREQLIGIVNDMDKPGVMNFLREVFNDRFIFERIDSESNKRKLFSQKFKISSEDAVELKGDPKQVRQKKEFIDVNKKEEQMDREKLVNALIANEATPYDDADKEYLMNMAEEKFASLTEFVDCKCKEMNEAKKTDDTPTPVENKQEEKKEEKTEVRNEEKQDRKVTVNDLDEATQKMINRGMQKYEEEKQTLIKALLANIRNPYKEDALQDMDVDELEKLCTLGRIPVFVGNRSPENRLDNKEEKDDTPSMPSYTQLVLNKGLMEDGTQLSMT